MPSRQTNDAFGFRFLADVRRAGRTRDGGQRHIAGVGNPPNPKKVNYQYWTNAAKPETHAEWAAGATETLGSWWPHWIRWLTAKSGGMVTARTPGKKLGVIEDDSMVFRGDAPVTPDARENIANWLASAKGERWKVEQMLNHEHLIDLFSERYRQRQSDKIYLARVVREMWEAKLKLDLSGPNTCKGEENRRRTIYFTSSSSTSKISVAPPGMTPPAPRAP
jgi:hypothetical protein